MSLVDYVKKLTLPSQVVAALCFAAICASEVQHGRVLLAIGPGIAATGSHYRIYKQVEGGRLNLGYAIVPLALSAYSALNIYHGVIKNDPYRLNNGLLMLVATSAMCGDIFAKKMAELCEARDRRKNL